MAHIRLDDLKKLELASVPAQSTLRGEDPVVAIIKVRRADYVPSGVRVRARIDPHLFTAAFPASELARLEADSNVAAISVSKRLNQID